MPGWFARMWATLVGDPLPGSALAAAYEALDIIDAGTAQARRELARVGRLRPDAGLLAELPVVYLRLDPKGLIVVASEVAVTAIGGGEAGLIGRSVFEFLLPSDQEALAARIAQLEVGELIRTQLTIPVGKQLVASRIHVRRGRDGQLHIVIIALDGTVSSDGLLVSSDDRG